MTKSGLLPTPVVGQNVGPQPAFGAKKGFRVTAWFKRGEIEQELAKTAALQSTTDSLAGAVAVEAVVSDASLTSGDHSRLTLDTGSISGMQSVPPQPLVVGQRMSDEEIVAEIGGSHRRKLLAVAAMALLAALVGAYFLFVH